MTRNAHHDLVEVPGFSFAVNVSKGSEQRAQIIAARCKRAHRFLGSVFEFDPSMRVLVLAPEHWQTYATYPLYGMPHYRDRDTLVVAGQNNRFWQSMTPPIEALPDEVAQALRSVYGRPDDSIDFSAFFDLLAVHEVSRIFHVQASCNFPRRWLMELFCNLCLHAYVATTEPEHLPELEMFPQLVVDRGFSHLTYHSLEDFEHLYVQVGPENYGWYQCQLHVAAKHIYEEGGTEVLHRLWSTFLYATEDFSNAQLAAHLKAEVHPAVERVLTAWPT